jgi:hypothetical protein
MADTPHHPPLRLILRNVLLFQACWFVCVLGGAWGLPWLGPIAALGVIAVHLRDAPRPGPEALLITVAAVTGALWDGQLAGHGWVEYDSGVVARWLAPVWIIAMWASFATLLNVSLRWLHNRFGLALLFGAVGAPFAYLGGAALGAARFPDQMIALAAIGAGWALILPLLVTLARRLDGIAEIPQEATQPAPHTPEATSHV